MPGRPSQLELHPSSGSAARVDAQLPSERLGAVLHCDQPEAAAWLFLVEARLRRQRSRAACPLRGARGRSAAPRRHCAARRLRQPRTRSARLPPSLVATARCRLRAPCRGRAVAFVQIPAPPRRVLVERLVHPGCEAPTTRRDSSCARATPWSIRSTSCGSAPCSRRCRAFRRDERDFLGEAVVHVTRDPAPLLERRSGDGACPVGGDLASGTDQQSEVEAETETSPGRPRSGEPVRRTRS